MNIKSDNNDHKELLVCNKHISMILAENKYLYYSKSDKIIENEKEYDIDDISIITNFDSLEEAIGKNKIIYSTTEDIMVLNLICDNIDKKNDNIELSVKDFLTGVNACDFQKIEEPDKIDTLPSEISLIDAESLASHVGYFLYNKSIGLTIEILYSYFTSRRVSRYSAKYFYFTVNFLKHAISSFKQKIYFAYYLANLFDDSKIFKSFYKKISPSIAKINNDYIDLIFLIINEYQKLIAPNSKDRYYFLFDNIYSKNDFRELFNKYEKEKSQLHSNTYFYFYIQLNNETSDFLYDKEYNFIFINNDYLIRPQEYIDLLNDENFDKNYLNKIENDYNQIMNNHNNIDKFILMLKMKYIKAKIKL